MPTETSGAKSLKFSHLSWLDSNTVRRQSCSVQKLLRQLLLSLVGALTGIRRVFDHGMYNLLVI